jgi:hypothetical protein
MLCFLLVLAVLLKLVKIWKAHVKRSERHDLNENEVGVLIEGERRGEGRGEGGPG